MAQPVQAISDDVELPLEPDMMEEYDDDEEDEDVQRKVVEEYQQGEGRW